MFNDLITSYTGTNKKASQASLTGHGLELKSHLRARVGCWIVASWKKWPKSIALVTRPPRSILALAPLASRVIPVWTSPRASCILS